jgi:DDE superfamily endonuclease
VIPPKANSAFVAAMEDVLAVYTRPRDPDRPLVCLDETSKQLLAETRVPIAMKPGRPARCDYEYERNGTANLFMMFAPLEGWRRVKVTDRHTAVDYAHVLNDLADVHFANAKTTFWSRTISTSNRPLHGTNTLVRMAMSRSRGESMTRQAMTPAALQPKPIIIVSACLPCAPARLNSQSRLNATRGR